MIFPLLARAASIEIITLKYRRAEDLIPVIQPLLSKGEAVSGMGNELIVRTANPRGVRKLVEKLDRAPKNLMITVRQGEVSTERESLYGTESASGSTESHVRVLEGSPSFISIGRSIPSQVVTMGPYGATVTNTYNEVSSGFYVVATVHGDEVSIEASPVYEHPVDGGIDRQKLSTRATGRIGQWIELGGAGQASSDAEEYHTRMDRIWIRVDQP